MLTPRCPYVLADARGPIPSEACTELTKIPGIRIRGGSRLVLPHHTVSVANGLLAVAGIEIRTATWREERDTTRSWDDLSAQLRSAGEVRPFVLDGFLTPYQTEGLSLIGSWNGAHLWWPPGAGKTVAGILWALIASGPLVVVTKAAARLQIGREIERFTHLRPFVVKPKGYVRKGVKKESLRDYLEDCQESSRRPVVVVAWEALTRNLPALKRLAPTTVIFDELHQAKQSSRWQNIPVPEIESAEESREVRAEAAKRGGFVSKKGLSWTMVVPKENRSMSAALLARASKRRLGMTATPIPDRVEDLWSQLDIIEPDAWGNRTAYVLRYADAKPGTYGGLDTTGMSNLPELRERLLSVTHKIDHEVTHRHLPPKRRQSVYVPPSDQTRPSAGFPAELKRAAKSGPTKVLEVRRARAASAKRKAVMGLVEDHVSGNHKVVIFTGRRRDCDVLGVSIGKQKWGKGLQVWVAHGDVSATDRQGIVDDYMEHPGPCVLVATGYALGESLNLQDTDAAMFVMLPWSPGDIDQWEGRFTRHGQKRPVLIYYVIAEDTVDEYIASRLLSKFPAIDRLVQNTALASAADAISGFDDMSDAEFASAILADIA